MAMLIYASIQLTVYIDQLIVQSRSRHTGQSSSLASFYATVRHHRVAKLPINTSVLYNKVQVTDCYPANG